MESHIGNIMTLSNSIIGVSILAMPFCFKQCGIILATLMLITSSIVTRFTSHFLVKSAIIARRRTFELLAFHAFGTTGKFVVELGIIGFLMGTCVAFFVIIGDLGPVIIAKMMGTKPTDNLRISILVGVAIFCVLPLGLLKNVDSLHSVCTATIGFYFCLVLKTVSESASRFVLDNWMDEVELWRPAGILQCLPIFSMALSCQTQLFEIYEIVANPTLDKMNYIVRFAVNICVAVYVSVGFFGYIAFSSQPFTGNILMSFRPSVITDVMKIGFVLSVAFSFPLVIFPCRASLNSLLFKKGYTPYEGTSNYIPEARFKLLTLIIITTSLVIGILIPNIEVVLGLVGSTIGIMICLIFPVTCFICISTKNTNERLLAQILLFVGVIVMVLGTYANLYAMEEINTNIITEKNPALMKSIIPIGNGVNLVDAEKFLKLKIDEEPIKIKPETIKNAIIRESILVKQKPEDIRLEPPQPIEPDDNIIKTDPPLNKVNEIKLPIEQQTEVTDDKSKNENIENIIQKSSDKKTEIINTKLDQIISESKKAEEVDIEAIKKEDKELQEEEKSKQKEEEKAKAKFLETLEKHKEKQMQMIEEQKELLQQLKKENKEFQEKQKIEHEVQNEARRKAASQIFEVAKKAIENLVPDNKVLKSNINNENKNSEKLNDMIINDPIARQLLKISNNTSNITNNINQNIPNGRMLPLPMAKNISLSEILYQNKNGENTKEAEPKLIINDEKDENANEINLRSNVTKTNKQNNEEKPPNVLIENVPIAPVTSKVIGKKEEEIHKLPDNSLNHAKRDILSNVDGNIENTNRAKREILKNNVNNEKCELEDENTFKTQSPLVKMITEISKSDLFKQESNNIIEALKTHLKSKSVHLKKK